MKLNWCNLSYKLGPVPSSLYLISFIFAALRVLRSHSMSGFLFKQEAKQMAESRTGVSYICCKLNFSETSRFPILERRLKKESRISPTCMSSTPARDDNADKECRYLVRRIQRKAPESP
jgi:hypothetical protein